MAIYFISDLHLYEGSDSDILFDKFLNEKTQEIEELYILGDFFEYWVGDDLMTPYHRLIADKLYALNQLGIPVYFMHGNRDFLISKKFLELSRCKVIPDPFVLHIDDIKVLLMHGDSLCTLDKRYQIFRAISRNPIVKYIFLLLPGKLRTNIALSMRNSAKQSTTKREYDPKYDVAEPAVLSILKKNNIQQLIHGHTHIPAKHQINDELTRFVLGDWHKEATIAKIGASKQIELLNFT